LLAIVSFILTLSSQPSTPSSNPNLSPLLIAEHHGNVAVACALLAAGAEVTESMVNSSSGEMKLVMKRWRRVRKKRTVAIEISILRLEVLYLLYDIIFV
jgi:hypothetical protein